MLQPLRGATRPTSADRITDKAAIGATLKPERSKHHG